MILYVSSSRDLPAMSDDIRKSNLHDDPAFREAAEKGGLFDVGPNELDDDIGRHVRFPGAEEGTYYAHEHVIVAVQQDYKGDLAYRVQLAEDAGELGSLENDLGRVAPPDAVEFVEEEGGEEGGESER
ncbi:hypothetical protein [Salinibacter ruber]|uniref:hypothetical protein n=2 Tax=Salinibacter ruber TaxID=146919 RepID=UPI0021695747|nr:hypothetical protein [Salinibacter ruber]MCS3638951.1 putative GNAT superfamily acetyltransferase [Salinibacter ruber]